MKSKLSIILFGISFLIAILGEAFLLNVPNPDIFSIIGIGIVVILTGYLWFDSIWEHISSRNKKIMKLWEEARRQEAEKWESQYTELLKIQKATYSALKKSIIKMEDDLNQIIQLQNKMIEGQIKGLNISVNYGREHSKEIIEAIKKECEGINYEKQLKEIISLLQSYQDYTDKYITSDTIKKN